MKQLGGLLRSTAVVSAMTMISRVLGFARDMLFARYFGAGAATDAFFVAFKIPNFMRRLFAEGAFSQAFVPVFNEYKSQREQAEVKLLADSVAGTFGGILFIVTVLGVIGAPLIIAVVGAGYVGKQGDQFQMAVEMLRWTFPYLMFISLTAMAAGILNAYSRFAIPALTPVLLNVVLIGATLFVSPYFDPPVMALAVGVFVAGLAQLLFQFPFLRRIHMLPRPRWNAAHEGVQRIKTLMIPALFGSSVMQLNLLFDTLLATFLVTGSVSWLYYSDRLMEFPLGVFGIAIATVILPSMSQRHAESDPARFSLTLEWGLRLAVLIAAPAAAALAVLAGPLLTTLFQYGQFDAFDVEQARWSLLAYAIGLPGFIFVKVLAPGYFARQNTKTPVKVGIIAAVANMVFNLMLIWHLAHVGLALATSMSAFVNAGLLFWGLRREGVFKASPGWGRYLVRVFAATGAMVLLIVEYAPPLSDWLAADFALRAGWMAATVGGGALVYFVALLVVGVRVADFRH